MFASLIEIELIVKWVWSVYIRVWKLEPRVESGAAPWSSRKVVQAPL